MLIRKASLRGVLLTLILGTGLTVFYFGQLLQRPSHNYFSTGGDGFQIYYACLYHVKHDKEWWRQESTNYPYGESIFFTGSMPFLNNFAKIFGPESTSFCVWLINMTMLLAPLAGALFLYLLFRHLKLPWLYAAFTANGIAFLSPQIIRMTGHYSLTWVFLIPAFIYLLLKFYAHPNLRKSWAISFLVFLAATTHMYYLAFFLVLGSAYYFVLFITRDRGFGRAGFTFKHFAIQLLLPAVLIQMIAILTDPVTDRTKFPWGYTHYHATFDGIFYPFGKPYEPLFQWMDHWFPEWEGVAYVGLAAMIGLGVIGLVQLYRLLKKRFRLLLHVTDNKPLNIFFWTSVFLAWVACAHPFINGHEEWLHNAGPLKQFRAIGRFAWLFFYLANIIAIYRVYKIFRNRAIQWSFASLLIICLLVDVHFTLNHFSDRLSNRIDALEDKEWKTEENQWLRQVDPSAYQAILPLPFFCIGSENVERHPQDNGIVIHSYIASLQTGLPLMATTAARTSRSQAIKMVSLVLDPTGNPTAAADLKSRKPLLLLVINNGLNDNEQRIISLATHITSTPYFSLYSLDPILLQRLQQESAQKIKNIREAEAKWNSGEFLLSDSGHFFYDSYDEKVGPALHGNGSLPVSTHENFRLYDTIIPPGDYVTSLWIEGITKDIYPRTKIETVVFDEFQKSTFYEVTGINWGLKAIQGDWALVEIPFRVDGENSRMQVTVLNTQLKKGTIQRVDEFMVRPAHVNVYRKGEIYFRNNRYYSGHP
ncbi:MAG TPA: hypothetical protein VI731_11040 [Bacteroidia bacterium]|nr:hypothetical protein [Bacteroidia bacterium]